MYIKLYPFNPNPLCTTHKQPQNNNNKILRGNFFFMYFLFSFRQTNNRIEVKRVVFRCCCCYALCWNGEENNFDFQSNFFSIFHQLLKRQSKSIKNWRENNEKKAKENNKTKLYHNQLVRNEVGVGGLIPVEEHKLYCLLPFFNSRHT